MAVEMSKWFSNVKSALAKTIWLNARIWIWISFATSLFGVFLFVTSEVREATSGEIELIGTLDRTLLELAGTLRSPKLNEAAVNITALGSGTVLGIFVCVVILFLCLKRRYLDTAQILGAALGSAALSYVMKAYFERPRPILLSHLVEVQSYSYPSGHSLSGSAVYFTFSVLLFLNFKTRIERSVAIGASLIVISLISISRIFLGVHYLSDVIAGVLVGIGWASALAAFRVFYEFSNTKHEHS